MTRLVLVSLMVIVRKVLNEITRVYGTESLLQAFRAVVYFMRFIASCNQGKNMI